MPVFQPEESNQTDEVVDKLRLLPKRTSVHNLDLNLELNSEQKNLQHFMNEHPFESTTQAPDVDINMVRDLGNAESKSKIDENTWKVQYSNGTRYEGGIIVDSSSKDYEQPITYGKFEFPNGDKYEGSVGERAKGVYTHSNGVVYEGQFYRLTKSGNGTQRFPSGDQYTGKFKNNLYHGKGSMMFANGDSYHGTFINGKREHIGTYKYPSGEQVVGDWDNDMLHGKGEYNFTNGSKVRSAFESSQVKL